MSKQIHYRYSKHDCEFSFKKIIFESVFLNLVDHKTFDLNDLNICVFLYVSRCVCINRFYRWIIRSPDRSVSSIETSAKLGNDVPASLAMRVRNDCRRRRRLRRSILAEYHSIVADSDNYNKMFKNHLFFHQQ
jgi:hypothetical protein